MARNAENTAHLKPPTGCTSWLDYWNRNSGLFGLALMANYKCPGCGKFIHDGMFDGSHLIIANSASDKMYICPLCKSCNHDNKEFLIPRALLVTAS